VLLNPTATTSLRQMLVISFRNGSTKKASQPFEKDREGFVLAEGCVVP
jgi:3-oxoacyl-(acyl-carrier-protein) synthase